jgi:hypothetical protein
LKAACQRIAPRCDSPKDGTRRTGPRAGRSGLGLESFAADLRYE